jgi:hypothetical protein
MLQGRYSARGGPIKGCTATLMFSRNNRKNISGTILVFRKKKFLSKTILRLGHKIFLTWCQKFWQFWWKRPTLLSTPSATFPLLWCPYWPPMPCRRKLDPIPPLLPLRPLLPHQPTKPLGTTTLRPQPHHHPSQPLPQTHPRPTIPSLPHPTSPILHTIHPSRPPLLHHPIHKSPTHYAYARRLVTLRSTS